ncbi:hypothetical protein [Bacillus safensis]|uniref:hypothetical protein n=1 Tax=Bacillus safensis TaxID=561879 RepID=UPI002E1B3548|nr:hypothetical protein [Bacillus safensis]
MTDNLKAYEDAKEQASMEALGMVLYNSYYEDLRYPTKVTRSFIDRLSKRDYLYLFQGFVNKCEECYNQSFDLSTHIDTFLDMCNELND